MKREACLPQPATGVLEIIPRPFGHPNVEGGLRVWADIRGCPEGPTSLWYEFDPEGAPAVLPDRADAFVLAMLFPAMKHGRDIHVHGRVSTALLENLERFNEVWSEWSPHDYRRINVRATQEEDDHGPADPRGVLLFSGGVDSCHAMLAHKRGWLGRRSRLLQKAVLVHGADFQAEGDPRAAAATRHARELAGSLGVQLAVVRTNVREFGGNWEHAHGCCLTSCLHWFSREAGHGLIASTISVPNMSFPWGTHPLTDHLCGSGDFKIEYDSLSAARGDKVEIVASWPEALEHLRVCYSNRPDEFNCGRCRKCLMTTLAFMACGKTVATLPAALDARQIWSLRDMPRWAEHEVRTILKISEKNGRHQTPMFRTLHRVLLYNKYIHHGFGRLKPRRRR